MSCRNCQTNSCVDCKLDILTREVRDYVRLNEGLRKEHAELLHYSDGREEFWKGTYRKLTDLRSENLMMFESLNEIIYVSMSGGGDYESIAREAVSQSPRTQALSAYIGALKEVTVN